MSLKRQQNLKFFRTQILKNSFVDTFVSTKWLFLGSFLNFHFSIPKYFQIVNIRGIEIVTKNTPKSMVTTVFCSFLETILGSPPYEKGSFLRSVSRFGDFFDAMSEVVTIKNRTADFIFIVKENDRH